MDILKIFKRYCGIFLFVLFVTGIIVGCSPKNPIVGTWIYTEDSGREVSMEFYEDGTCFDTPVKTRTSADAVSYKLQKDGMLIFTMEWDGPIRYESAEDQEKALDDSDYYYLSKDTFILHKKIYKKK